MKLGSVELYANHPLVVIGSTADIETDLSLDGSPATASETHALVATRGQAGLVRIALWKEAGPLVGTTVFDGHLAVRDQFLVVRDVENTSRLSTTIGPAGRYRIVIMVDDPGSASRLDIIVDRGQGVRSLTAAQGLQLYDVSLPSDVDLGKSSELALLLSEHDVELSRLAAAIKLIGGPDTPSPHVRAYWVRMLVEWLRWLSPWQSLAESRALGALIDERLVAVSTDSLDTFSVELSREILDTVLRAKAQRNA